MNLQRLMAVAACLSQTSTSTARATALDNLTVDLGYALYRGVENVDLGLSIWKGIQFAAPPVGKLRWQAPRAPDTDRSGVRPAEAFGPKCPQQFPATSPPPLSPGNEDCLYLNVYAPSSAPAGGLPVLVNIHGGGYGLGDGGLPMEHILGSNGNGFVAVTVQYRLGAFGFASSAEIKARGVLNAGLLDMEFALQWVQTHISKFGGDPQRVTIGGESAGGGAVMLLGVARGGSLGTSLFRYLMPSSPYLPTQPFYDDEAPVERYRRFAELAGCPGDGPVFDCLVAMDSIRLQSANSNVTVGSLVPAYNWAFIPVTDGEFLTEPTSLLLSKKQINGDKIFVGSNANEADGFVPRDISTEARLRDWIKSNFVNLSDLNVTAILDAYPSVPGPDDPSSPRFETDGLGPATAVNVSQVATGHQQRALNIYAESTFVCPAYWLSDAFNGQGLESYHYQLSVPFAFHGLDVSVGYLTPAQNIGPDFTLAFRRIFGNFIITGNPSISNEDANGASSDQPGLPNNASAWPLWTMGDRKRLVNLNQTGGTPYQTSRNGINITQLTGPSLRNAFAAVDAYSWEGGRGRRCDFWQGINHFIPQR